MLRSLVGSEMCIRDRRLPPLPGYSQECTAGNIVLAPSSHELLGCLRHAKFCSVGKHINIIMKPTNSPTQGQPNPRQNRLKEAFGPLFCVTFFPQQIIFRGLGLVLYRNRTTRNLTQPKIVRKHLNNSSISHFKNGSSFFNKKKCMHA